MKQQNYNLVRNLIVAVIGAIAIVNTALADNAKDDVLKGCYKVDRGYLAESAADTENVIGNYKFVLSQGDQKNNHVIEGPMRGTESESGGSHLFGTKERVGTLSTQGDEFTATSVSCFNGQGVPLLVKGSEFLNFYKGTGIFSGLISGKVEVRGTIDFCTDPSNPIADLQVVDGEICFK